MRVTKKSDRLRYAKQVKTLAEANGCHCEMNERDRRISLSILHRDTEVGCHVGWDGSSSLDCHVVSWFMRGWERPQRRFSTYAWGRASINAYHGQKATDVVSQADLLDLLTDRLAAISDGSAFVGDGERA